MRKVLAIFLAAGLTMSTSFAAANLAPEEVFGASCVRGAIPSAWEEKACSEWLNISAQPPTNATSVFGAHMVGNNANYYPVATPLEIQTSVYQITNTNSSCSLAISVRFKWNGIPGAVGPNAANKIIEIVPTLRSGKVKPPFEGLLDAVAIDFKTKKLGWKLSFDNSSVLTGKNGKTGITENWNLSNGESAKTLYEQGPTGRGWGQGAIQVPSGDGSGFYQDRTAPLFVHYVSTTSFRESHNRTNGQYDTPATLPSIWFTSEGQFIWRATNSNSSCAGSGVSVEASYVRTETVGRNACKFSPFDSLNAIAKIALSVIPIPIIKLPREAGSLINIGSEVALGQLGDQILRKEVCGDVAEIRKQSANFSPLFP